MLKRRMLDLLIYNGMVQNLFLTFKWWGCQLWMFNFFRSLYLGSMSEYRVQAIDISDLKELLHGCTQLEVRFNCKSN